jgi:hypothetical protein
MLHGIHIIYKEGWPKTIAILVMDIGRLQNWTGALLGRYKRERDTFFLFLFFVVRHIEMDPEN